MWILPKQLHTSAFVADMKALELDLDQSCQMSENALLWRSKPSTSQTWLRRWKKVKYIQHLFTRMLKPSHTESFVDAWTSYLAAFHANHLAMPETAKQQMIQDICFHTSQTESENADQQLSFLKMWKESSQPRQQTENQFCNMSCEHWKAWVTEQRQEYSQRVKLAHLTKESVSLSWATPQATDVRTDVRKPEERSAKAKKGGCKNLREEVMNWPTATARDWKGCGNATIRKDGRSRIDNLESVIKYGQPDQMKRNTNGNSQELFPTPRANKVHPEITEQNRHQLANRKKANLEEDIAGHCGKATGKLNPNWVEQLMGIPVGWTQLPTDWID